MSHSPHTHFLTYPNPCLNFVSTLVMPKQAQICRFSTGDIAVWHPRRQFTGRIHDTCNQLTLHLRTHTETQTHRHYTEMCRQSNHTRMDFNTPVTWHFVIFRYQQVQCQDLNSQNSEQFMSVWSHTTLHCIMSRQTTMVDCDLSRHDYVLSVTCQPHHQVSHHDMFQMQCTQLTNEKHLLTDHRRSRVSLERKLDHFPSQELTS